MIYKIKVNGMGGENPYYVKESDIESIKQARIIRNGSSELVYNVTLKGKCSQRFCGSV